MSGSIKLSSPDTGEFWEIGISYEDPHLLVIHKPSGLLSSPDRYDPNRPNLMRLLHRDVERGAKWVRDRQVDYLMNVHRLDFETSGLIVLAKSKPVLTHLTNQFGSDKTIKFYSAIVQGAPREERFQIDAALAPHPRNPAVIRVDSKQGKKSSTEFEVLQRFRGYALLSCRPLTGRTHQIRVHATFAGYPLVGDKVYGGGPLFLSHLKPGYKPKPGESEKPLMGRVALHAERLQFLHPITGETVAVEAPRPKDFEVALKYLSRFA